MVSIIICSINDQLFEQVSRSIESSVGSEFEIIRIENSTKEYSISKAYNIGALSAKYPFLCFVHEDVIFRSNNWGKELINFFNKQKDAGIVGVAGSRFKSLSPSVWAQGLFQTDFYNLIQPTSTGPALARNKSDNGPEYPEVNTLDGVFLFTKKKIWGKHKFDEEKFNKFHCYDLDFALQVGQEYKLFVSYAILIEHLSLGSLNKDWVRFSIRLSEKWKNQLPVGDIPAFQKKEIEWRNKKIFLFRMNILGFSTLMILKHFLKWGYFTNFSLKRNFNFAYTLICAKLKITNNNSFY